MFNQRLSLKLNVCPYLNRYLHSHSFPMSVKPTMVKWDKGVQQLSFFCITTFKSTLSDHQNKMTSVKFSSLDHLCIYVWRAGLSWWTGSPMIYTWRGGEGGGGEREKDKCEERQRREKDRERWTEGERGRKREIKRGKDIEGERETLIFLHKCDLGSIVFQQDNVVLFKGSAEHLFREVKLVLSGSLLCWPLLDRWPTVKSQRERTVHSNYCSIEQK